MFLIGFVRNFGLHTTNFYDSDNNIIQRVEGCSNTPWGTNDCEYCKQIVNGRIKHVNTEDPTDTDIYLDCRKEDLSILPFEFCQKRCSR